MINESRLNVYVLGSDLSSRQRERIQAQVETALRSLPSWTFEFLRQRIEALGVAHLPLIIEPRPTADSGGVLSLGQIQSRPAVRLSPLVLQDRVDWGQRLAGLLAKAIAYIAAPDAADDFWQRWSEAANHDRLREQAAMLAPEYGTETDLGMFIEMFAAYALSPKHNRWDQLTHVRAFFDGWRRDAG